MNESWGRYSCAIYAFVRLAVRCGRAQNEGPVSAEATPNNHTTSVYNYITNPVPFPSFTDLTGTTWTARRVQFLQIFNQRIFHV